MHFSIGILTLTQDISVIVLYGQYPLTFTFIVTLSTVFLFFPCIYVSIWECFPYVQRTLTVSFSASVLKIIFLSNFYFSENSLFHCCFWTLFLLIIELWRCHSNCCSFHSFCWKKGISLIGAPLMIYLFYYLNDF